jgi:hypothetical protein
MMSGLQAREMVLQASFGLLGPHGGDLRSGSQCNQKCEKEERKAETICAKLAVTSLVDEPVTLPRSSAKAVTAIRQPMAAGSMRRTATAARPPSKRPLLTRPKSGSGLLSIVPKVPPEQVACPVRLHVVAGSIALWLVSAQRSTA